MDKINFIVFIIIFVLITKVSNSQEEKEVFFDPRDPNNPDFWSQPNPDLSQVTNWNEITDENLNRLSPEKLGEALSYKFGSKVTIPSGTAASISGNILTVSGTTIDLSTMSGKSISVSGNDVFIDGEKYNNAKNIRKEGDKTKADSVQYFESGTTTFINAEGVSFSPNAFEIEKADSVSYEGSTSTKVIKYVAETGKFKVNSADRVIIETIVFDKIKNSTFILKDGKLISADVVSDKINNSVKIPNLIPQSSQYIEVNYNLNSSFGVNYRKEPDKIEFRLDENNSIIFADANNISFTSYSNDSYFAIIKDVPPIYRIKKGILNYSTNETIEQLESTCGLSDVNINFIVGFIKLMLSPRNVTVLCSGSRYNLIDKLIKEKSYSIYNIGEQNYYLGFEKGISSDSFNSFIFSLQTRNYGFIGNENKRINLNGIVEYDRLPEKELFPALSIDEYYALPIEWKGAIISYDDKNRITIDSSDIKINVTATNEKIEDKKIIELNSGYFKIREIGSSRFGSFNKQMIYPDYISEYRFNDEPLIKIENKKLIESSADDGRATIMFTPNTDESIRFIDWLKSIVRIRDFESFKKRFFGKK